MLYNTSADKIPNILSVERRHLEDPSPPLLSSELGLARGRRFQEAAWDFFGEPGVTTELQTSRDEEVECKEETEEARD